MQNSLSENRAERCEKCLVDWIEIPCMRLNYVRRVVCVWFTVRNAWLSSIYGQSSKIIIHFNPYREAAETVWLESIGNTHTRLSPKILSIFTYLTGLLCSPLHHCHDFWLPRHGVLVIAVSLTAHSTRMAQFLMSSQNATVWGNFVDKLNFLMSSKQQLTLRVLSLLKADRFRVRLARHTAGCSRQSRNATRWWSEVEFR